MNKIREIHPLAGKTVTLKSKDALIDGQKFWVEDWVINMPGNKSWQDLDGNICALNYAVKAAVNDIPPDDEVIYGKIGSLGYMVHISELGEIDESVPTKYSSYNKPVEGE